MDDPILPLYAFCIGGHDLEMVAIQSLLSSQAAAGNPQVASVHDKGLAWGARASAYQAEITAAIVRGQVPVLVELHQDIDLPDNAVLIDHHGDRSQEPCSLRQVFDLVRLPEDQWSRHFALVAANDTGHIMALRRFGATESEVAAIRRADRVAQGVSAQEEAAGIAALKAGQAFLDDTLLVVELPHSRSATVADPMAISGDKRDLLILSPNSTEFFGEGSRIAILDRAFPGGWRGGELPVRGFWGISRAIGKSTAVNTLQIQRPRA